MAITSTSPAIWLTRDPLFHPLYSTGQHLPGPNLTDIQGDAETRRAKALGTVMERENANLAKAGLTGGSEGTAHLMNTGQIESVAFQWQEMGR